MFNTELKERIKNLQTDIEYRDRMIKSLEADLERLRKERNEAVRIDVQSSDFVIDWKNLDVFSVERMGEDHTDAYTILGYWVHHPDNSKSVDEWKFYCSHEQHEKLAKEFRDASTK